MGYDSDDRDDLDFTETNTAGLTQIKETSNLPSDDGSFSRQPDDIDESTFGRQTETQNEIGKGLIEKSENNNNLAAVQEEIENVDGFGNEDDCKTYNF